MGLAVPDADADADADALAEADADAVAHLVAAIHCVAVPVSDAEASAGCTSDADELADADAVAVFPWRAARAAPRAGGLDAVSGGSDTIAVQRVPTVPKPRSEAEAAEEARAAHGLLPRYVLRISPIYPQIQKGKNPMPVIMRETTVAAGQVNENLLAGSAFEFARQNALVSMGLNASATGGFATINSGGDVIAEEFAPPIASVYPIIPDGMYFSDVAAAGDRLVVRYRNPTGGALVVRVVCQVTPL